MTRSTRWAAVWAMRRLAHDGQNPCRLQLKAEEHLVLAGVTAQPQQVQLGTWMCVDSSHIDSHDSDPAQPWEASALWPSCRMAYTRGHAHDRGYGREEIALYGTCASWHGAPCRRTRSGRYAASLRPDRGACRRVPWAVDRCASGGAGVGGQCPNANPIVADGLAGATQRLCVALYRHCRE